MSSILVTSHVMPTTIVVVTQPTNTLEGALGKDMRKSMKKDTSKYSPKVTPPCSLCDVKRHPTNQFPSFEELKVLLHASQVLLPSSLAKDEKYTTPHNKGFCTNHPCTICTNYGHYMHHCLEITWYQNVLNALHHTTMVSPSLPPTLDVDDVPQTIYYISEDDH